MAGGAAPRQTASLHAFRLQTWGEAMEVKQLKSELEAAVAERGMLKTDAAQREADAKRVAAELAQSGHELRRMRDVLLHKEGQIGRRVWLSGFVATPRYRSPFGDTCHEPFFCLLGSPRKAGLWVAHAEAYVVCTHAGWRPRPRRR